MCTRAIAINLSYGSMVQGHLYESRLVILYCDMEIFMIQDSSKVCGIELSTPFAKLVSGDQT